jgi:hypothetical protein
VIGNPVHHPATGERVAWDVVVEGAAVRVSGRGGQVLVLPHVLWDVTASDQPTLVRACRALADLVIAALAKTQGARTLSHEDRAFVNQLLRDGVALGEAMKRVRTRVDDAELRRVYGWPLPADATHEEPLPVVVQRRPPPIEKPTPRADDQAAFDGDDDESAPAARKPVRGDDDDAFDGDDTEQ